MESSPFDIIIDKFNLAPDDYDIFKQALTHRSYITESNNVKCNETLEFFGDSILGMVIAEHLFNRFPSKNEGDFTKLKSIAVSESSIAEAFYILGFAEALYLGPGEDQSGGRSRPSILANAYEAMVAAIYITFGYNAVREFILNSLDFLLKDIESSSHNKNYKSILQEITQDVYKATPKYKVISSSGSDHDKLYIIEVSANNQPLGRGDGKNKKQAEQAAAKKALGNKLIKKFYERMTKDE